MIGQLSGLLIEKNLPTIIVDVNGVGYELDVPMTTGFALPEVGEKVVLSTHFVVREDAQLLYGFIDKTARQLFRTLIKVNGVGAKMALAIMSGMDTQTLVTVVHDQDVAMLTQIPGIGKKTAERLLVELKDSLDNKLAVSESTVLPLEDTVSGNTKADAISALVSLGYKPVEAKKMIDKIFDPALGSEALIKQALQFSLREA